VDPAVAIVSCHNDIHALTVRRRYHDLVGGTCAIIEADTLAGSDGVTWRSNQAAQMLPVVGEEPIDITDVDVIWYRRANMPQLASSDDPDHRQFINSSTNAALRGALETSFTGTWISSPAATQSAENKINQLYAAAAAGLAVPRTLISQDPTEVRDFVTAMNGAVVMKGLRFSQRQPLLTLKVEPHQLLDEEAIRLCPTIFQEYIPGERHLRILCAGEIHTMAVQAPDLDWRPHLDANARPFELNSVTQQRVHRLLEILELRMGVLDFKFRGDEPVFLEINPQGQFLFMEGMADIDLTSPFVRFLYETACAAHSRR
jgi:glutathione synthase/RimK-type ligase-like ATP-grasp enzyme